MSTQPDKLADALTALKDIQDRGFTAIKTSDLSRAHRERLLSNGFIRQVMKGWYIPTRSLRGRKRSSESSPILSQILRSFEEFSWLSDENERKIWPKVGCS